MCSIFECVHSNYFGKQIQNQELILFEIDDIKK